MWNTCVCVREREREREGGGERGGEREREGERGREREREVERGGSKVVYVYACECVHMCMHVLTEYTREVTTQNMHVHVCTCTP